MPLLVLRIGPVGSNFQHSRKSTLAASMLSSSSGSIISNERGFLKHRRRLAFVHEIFGYIRV
jgi:hypothetical protein